MDTRILYSVSLSIVAVVGGFYYFSGKSAKLDTAAAQSLVSTAKKIQVTQTNESGQLYAKANVENLRQWMKQQQAEVDKIEGMLFDNNQATYTFYAGKGLASNHYEDIKLFDNVTVTQLGNSNNQLDLTLKTNELTGNTKLNQIETLSPVEVSSTYANFTSQGMKGDLSTGQYDFFKIRGTYAPTQ